MSDRSFIEVQFPVSRVSKESYKERMANYSQTLTGLGKWWGRKPLVLVRAALLGLLIPASDDSEKDREIFLKLMTMDEEGLWLRKEAAGKKLSANDVVKVLTDEPHHARVEARIDRFKSEIPGLTHDLKSSLFAFMQGDEGSYRWKRGIPDDEKKAMEQLAFESLYYDEKLAFCVRPEHLEGPAPSTWKEINAHLGTKASSLPELVRELGQKRFGHVPRVGDAFCGGGSIPFEAARLGCDVYASDLNPVAALLTWAALHIVGGGPEVAEQVRKAQEEIYAAVDKQITEWGIEHNAKGHRADAYLYCVEVLDPETGWRVPLAPSWVIGENTKTVAILEPVKKEKRYRIQIKMNATAAEMKAAKTGTVQGGYVVHPMNENRIPMSLIRRENTTGLRMWEADDLVPRTDDVFQERLYCIRWVDSFFEIKNNKQAKWKRIEKVEGEALPNFEALLEKKQLRRQEIRYYAEPDHDDLRREERVLELLQAMQKDWQEKGYIPNKKIEPGPKTSEPIRTRGWTHWQHLFNPRQLLTLGFLSQKSVSKNMITYIALLLVLGRLSDWFTKLCRWGTGQNRESIAQTFFNQALNTLYNYGCKALPLSRGNFFNEQNSKIFISNQNLELSIQNAQDVSYKDASIWMTDPPYADAINYHELSEFFLAWYEKHLQRLFPEWPTDSRRALAIRGEAADFRKAMIEAYKKINEDSASNSMQIVMFTHQDASVWADLAIILWAAGLQVTAAWTIATETEARINQGNYVQGTVLLVLRKNTAAETAFLDELVPRIEAEVRAQVESMERIEDKEEPNFGDTDYQLAAYAAALRVLTGYKQIEDLDVEKELARPRKNTAENPLVTIIENARDVAASIRIPEGLDKLVWTDLTPDERLYLRGLVLESTGEYRSGAYQELARTYGVREYTDLLASARANETRVKTASELSNRQMSGDGFGTTLLRHILYAIFAAVQNESPQSGRNYLKTEVEGYWKQRANIIALLHFIARFQHNLPERAAECRMAG